MIRKFSILCIIILGLLICGCNAPKDRLKAFNAKYETSDLPVAALLAESYMSSSDANDGKDDILWMLQTANIERVLGNRQKSTATFDCVENVMKTHDLNRSGVVENVAAVAVNDNVVPYFGSQYDRVMVNTYKGLNFLFDKKMDLARVEFNRALDRQRLAREHFADQIAKLDAEMEEKQDSPKGELVKKSVENPKVAELLDEKYNLTGYQVYTDFVNPLANWLAAVFFELDGDLEKASHLYKQACGMVPDNNYIAQDLQRVENTLDTGSQAPGLCRVIFENGLGPVKEEWRLDLPVFVLTNQVKYVGIALPYLEYRDSAYQSLSIKAGENLYDTKLVVDVDQLVRTEFKEDIKGITTRAIAAAAAKAAAQYALEKQNNSAGSILSIGMALYSFATTAADVRIWSTLPKNFQTAEFPIPEDGSIFVKGIDNGCDLKLDISNCQNAIVYIRAITVAARPVVDVLKF